MIQKAKFKLNIELEDEIGPSKIYKVNETINFSNDKKPNSLVALKKITRRIRVLLTNIAKYGENGESDSEI